MWSRLLFLSAAVGSFAAPLNEERAAAPAVTIKNGTVVGSSSNNIDSFKGIPFALPPTGSLRLKPAQTITSTYSGGTYTATGTPTACPQFLAQVDSSNIPSDVLGELSDSPFAQAVTVTGEDCLTINVQRPSNVTPDSKLPVVFWIFGGGFEFGSTQTYDGSNLISTSVTLGHPVVYVAVNYRIGGFGFLAGKQMQADGSTNLGLRDQRLGLQWVQDNIAAFGGDPSKVTIWGESAGAISVYDQMIINGGDNTYNGQSLFRGAIMDSGCIVPAEDVASSKAQGVYDTVVMNAGCSGASDSLACLRSIDYQKLLRATNSVPGIFSYSSVNLAYLPRPDPNTSFFPLSPEIPLQSGNYAKVPLIIGDQEDEGTLFSLVQENITTTEQLIDYVGAAFINTPRSTVQEYVNTYPDDITRGSPFRTGLLNNIYPQYKRLAAILGDAVFNLRRRQFLFTVSSVVPSWSYLDSHFYGTPVLGTFHASDTLAAFDDVPIIPAMTYQEYYVSFANYLDPNAIGAEAPLINWPPYNTTKPTLVQFQALSNNLLADDYRNASFAVLEANFGFFRT